MFEITAALAKCKNGCSLDKALFFVTILSKIFWCSGHNWKVPGLILGWEFFQIFFSQKSNFFQSNGNIHASFEIRNVYQWSVLTKNVNESLKDYVKYQVFKASQELFLKYKVV